VVKAVKKPVSRFRIGRLKIGKKILCPLIDKQVGNLLPNHVQKVLRLRGQADKALRIQSQIKEFNEFRHKFKSRAVDVRTKALEAENNVRKVIADQVRQGTISETDGLKAIKKAVDLKHALFEAAQHIEIEADRLDPSTMARRIAESAFRNSTKVLKKRIVPIAKKAAADAFVDQAEQLLLYSALKQIPKDQHSDLVKIINLKGAQVQLIGGSEQLLDAIKQGKLKKMLRVKFGSSNKLPTGVSFSEFAKDTKTEVEEHVLQDLKDSVPIDVALDELRNILISHAPNQRDRIDDLFSKLPSGLEISRIVKQVKTVLGQIQKLDSADREELVSKLIETIGQGSDSILPQQRIENGLSQVGDAAEQRRDEAEWKQRDKEKHVSSPKTPANKSDDLSSPKVDCSELKRKYAKLRKAARDRASHLNCKKKSYSGCAVDVAETLSANYFFTTKLCSKAKSARCVEGVYAAYMACVEACNAAWRSSRQRLEPCGSKCYKTAESATKDCER
jgi:hypothetical protein